MFSSDYVLIIADVQKTPHILITPNPDSTKTLGSATLARAENVQCIKMAIPWSPVAGLLDTRNPGPARHSIVSLILISLRLHASAQGALAGGAVHLSC